MPIELEETHRAAEFVPVAKRTRIGEKLSIALIDNPESRDVKKTDDLTKQQVTVINPRTGKPKQELVIYGIVLPDNTAPVGRGEEQWVPAVGDVVRMIARGGAFGSYIEAKKALGRKLRIGDIIEQTVEYAQAYDANGAPTGNKLTDQRAVDALPRGRSVGFYGPVTIATNTNQQWIAAAERAYNERHAIELPDDERPF